MKQLIAFMICGVLWSLAIESTHAAVTTEIVEYEHDGVKLEGLLAYDNALTGKRPGILVVHEWWGHNEYARRRARELAAEGYVTFALDMYGKGIQTIDPNEASKLSKPFYDNRALMKSRAAAGLKQLKSSPLVDPSHLAAIGFCFGGTVSLELARSGAPLQGIISFHGGLATPHPESAKNIAGSILILNGAEDPMVKPEERAAFMNEMRSANVDWQFIEYGGAVHAFTNPEVDARNIPGAKYDARSEKRAFAAAKAFLSETLR